MAAQRPGLSIEYAARLFALIGDPRRLRILAALDRHGELNVLELARVLGCSSPTISHHIGLLRLVDLIKPRKAKPFVYYRLASPLARKLIRLVARDADLADELPKPTAELPQAGIAER